MRHMIVVCCFIASVFVPSSGRGVAHAGQAVTATESVVSGGGQQLGTCPQITEAFAVSAHTASAAGVPATGALTVACLGTGLLLHAHVTCLLVVGDEAVATGIIDQPPASAGQITVFDGVDQGTASHGPRRDLVRFSFEPFIVPAGQPGCYLPLLPPVAITAGNIVMHQG